jgi:hypothetical protein
MRPNTYKRIKYALEQRDLYINNEDIDLILNQANREKVDSEHVGIHKKRCRHNPREKAFYEHWRHENEIRPGINSGHGILQDLFIETDEPLKLLSRRHKVREITKQDRELVATVIQWLGSNCGMSFLMDALRDCGYTMRSNEMHTFKGSVHHLKTLKEYYVGVVRGIKRFEVRRDDRGFNAGDILILQEYDGVKKELTGRSLRCGVEFLLQGGVFGISQDYCVMSLSDPFDIIHTLTNQ